MLLLAAFMALAARQMPVAEFGLFSSVYAIALILTDVSDAGTGMQLILDSARNDRRTRRRQLSDLVLSRFVMHAGLLVLGCIAGLITHVFAVCIVGAFLSASFALRVLLQAEERCEKRYWRSSLMLLAERSVALLVLLISQAGSAQSVMACLLAGSLTVVVVPVSRLIANGSLRRARHLYRRATSLGITSFASDLLPLDVPIVAAVSGPTIAGLYAVPSRLLIPIAFVGAAISTVLVREFPDLPIDQIRVQTRRIFWGCSTLVLIIAGLIAGTAPWLILWWLGDRYSGSVLPLQISTITAVCASGSIVLSAALQAMGRKALVAATTVVVAVAYLIATAVGAYLWGAVGGAIGAAIVQIAHAGWLYSTTFFRMKSAVKSGAE